MDKILLEVFCIPTSRTYDYWVSKKMILSKVKEKMLEQIILYEKNSELFSNRDEIFLMDASEENILEESWTIEQIGLKSGDRIVIV